MVQQVIIDTDILIDFGKDKSDAIQTIAILEQKYDICLSVIIAMELYAGCRSKKDLKKIDDFLSLFRIIYVSKIISEKAFHWMREYRSSHGVEINDLLIAATAVSINSKFISKNQKHFKFLPDLNLMEYPLMEV